MPDPEDLEKENKAANDAQRIALGKKDPGHKARYWKEVQKNVGERSNEAYKNLASKPPSAQTQDPNALLGELIAWILMMLLGGIALGIERGMAEAVIKGMKTSRTSEFNEVSTNLDEMRKLIVEKEGYQKQLDKLNKDRGGPLNLDEDKKELEKKIKVCEKGIQHYHSHITQVLQDKQKRDANLSDTPLAVLAADKKRYEDSKEVAEARKAELLQQLQQTPSKALKAELDETDKLIQKCDKIIKNLVKRIHEVEANMDVKEEKRKAQQEQLKMNMSRSESGHESSISIGGDRTYSPLRTAIFSTQPKPEKKQGELEKDLSKDQSNSEKHKM